MMKITCIVGARPQFVKAAALIRAAERSFVTIDFIHTGQHYDSNMSEIFFRQMQIPTPKENLGIGNCHQGAMTGRMIEALESNFLKSRPDAVVVFGDTNSTLAGALAAAKMQIPIAHIEAGLRSYNANMPEEINRVLTDHCSTLLLTPTDQATKNLEKEGVPKEKIYQVGDIMVDALEYYKKLANEKSQMITHLKLNQTPYVLATVHRKENIDNQDNLVHIFDALSAISKQVPVICPLHPATKQALEKFHLINQYKQHIKMIEPIGYFDMIVLSQHAKGVLTDSGGLQKEAYLLNKPCTILRKETEWTELIENQCSFLPLPFCKNQIIKTFEQSLQHPSAFKKGLYGDGKSSERIVNTLRDFLYTELTSV